LREVKRMIDGGFIDEIVKALREYEDASEHRQLLEFI
jgi:hypothetical protein